MAFFKQILDFFKSKEPNNLDRRIRINPNDFEAYYLRAESKAIQGDTNGAINDVNISLTINPDYYKSLCLLSEIFAISGRLHEALQLSAKAHRQQPDYPDGYLHRTVIKKNLGYYTPTLEDYAKVINLYPRSNTRDDALNQ